MGSSGLRLTEMPLDGRNRAGYAIDMFGAAFDACTSRTRYANGVSFTPAIAKYGPAMSLD
jgi:hypothetical protein